MMNPLLNNKSRLLDGEMDKLSLMDVDNVMELNNLLFLHRTGTAV